MLTRLGLALGLSACGGPQGPVTGTASLRIVAEPDNAVVEVDERYVGTAHVLTVRPHTLPAGIHRITVRSPGYFPHDLEVDLPPGETMVQISLRPEPAP